MSQLDHASAHELLADLALEPGALARLDSARHESASGLAAHLAVCADCSREVEAARRTEAALADVAAAAGGLAAAATDRAIAPPASLRAAVATMPRISGVTPALRRDTSAPLPIQARSRRIAGPRRLVLGALAAAVVTVVALGGVAYDASGRAASATAERERLESLIGTVEAILGNPAHYAVPLRTADGTASGTIAWTDTEIAVVATGLPVPTTGQTYRCWIERGGSRAAIGEMTVVGSTASWVGSVDAWGTVSLSDGGRFGVSLESAAGGISGPAILVADLQS